MNTAGFMIDKTHALGFRLHTPTRRHADKPGFVASAIYRGKELVQAFLRPYRAGPFYTRFLGLHPRLTSFGPLRAWAFFCSVSP